MGRADDERAAVAEMAEEEGYDFVGIHTCIAPAGGRYITREGMLFILGGEVALMVPGDEPVEERIIAAAAVGDSEVRAKPWWGFGTSMIMELGDTSYRVEPESIAQGSGYATPGKIKRARASVREFEAALDAAKQS